MSSLFAQIDKHQNNDGPLNFTANTLRKEHFMHFRRCQSNLYGNIIQFIRIIIFFTFLRM